MARSDEEQLIVQLEARISAFEKGLKRANQTAGKEFGAIEKRGQRMAKELDQSMAGAAAKVRGHLSNFGKGLLAGVVAGGVSGMVAGLRGVASSVADIANEAARAGVTTQVFQEWEAVAIKARIPMDAMIDAFKELNIRGDEFAQTAKGSAAEAFQRLGLTPAEVKEKLKNPADLMLLLIERTRQLKDTAAATRIFDEMFGGTGAERLVSLLGQSTDEIRATIAEAHTLGNVLSTDLIARAAEVDAKFNQITFTVGQNLKAAIVEAATALQDFINAFNGFEAQRSVKLDQRMAALGEERLDVERQIFELRSRTDGLAGDGVFGTSLGDSGTADGIAQAERRMEAIAAEEQMILKVLEARRELESPAPTTGSGGFTPAPYTAPVVARGGGSSPRRDASAAAAEREAEAVRRLIGELEHELSLVGATDLERETANALRQAGAAATADQQAKIVGLVAALQAEEEATRKASEASQELRDIGRDVLGGIVSDLRQGKSAADILANALDRVADKLASMALDGLFDGGGIGAVIGSIFGYDKGGYTGPGPKKRAAGIVHKGEVVWSQDDIRKAGGVAVVEAMRRGAPGYATGGPVGVSVPKMPSAHNMSIASRGNGGGDMRVSVGVRVDNDGKLQAFVDKVSRSNAAQVFSGGIGQYDKSLNRSFGSRMAMAQTRQG